MAEHNNHINFSLADIERYLQGRMLPKEMHDLEKAALQDPFLADAIEGYSQASSEVSNRHLNEIAAAIQSKQEDSKVVPIAQKSVMQWWKIAAMAIVIAGAGTASWLLLRQQNTTVNIAQTKGKADSVTSSVTVQAKADTIAPVLAEANKPVPKKIKSISKDLPLPATQAPVLMQASVDSAYTAALTAQKEASAMHSMMAPAPAKAENQNITADSFTLQNMDNAANKNVVIAQGQAKAYAINDTRSAEPNNNAYRKKTFASGSINTASLQQTKSFQFRGRVLNNNAQPVPSALVKLNNGKTATFTDEQGFFTLYSPDSISHVTVSSAGYIASESNLRKGAPNTIALKEDDKSLAEVVVTELMSRKQAAPNVPDTAAKSKGPYPEKGWPSFQEYVYAKLHKEQEYDSTYTGTVTGRSVELEFMVDANGIPYNIKVVHSVDEASDKKAIEIVKQGPRWIAGDKKNKKAKVTIKL